MLRSRIDCANSTMSSWHVGGWLSSRPSTASAKPSVKPALSQRGLQREGGGGVGTDGWGGRAKGRFVHWVEARAGQAAALSFDRLVKGDAANLPGAARGETLRPGDAVVGFPIPIGPLRAQLAALAIGS